MKKRLFALFLSIASLFSLVMMVVSAEETEPPLLVDGASLLSDTEFEKLSALLEKLTVESECAIAVVTQETFGDKSPVDFADDYYDYNGYGYGENDDGIMLAICMDERDYHITTYGMAYDNISESDLDELCESFVPYMSAGDYYTAFVEFAQASGKLAVGESLGEYEDKDPDAEVSYVYDDDPDYYDGSISFEPAFGINQVFISLLVGIVVGVLIVNGMKGQLKSVRAQDTACAYLKKDSLKLTRSDDVFLYQNVTRVARPKDSGGSGRSGGSHSGSRGGGGSHVSSSGRSHGGRSGKF